MIENPMPNSTREVPPPTLSILATIESLPPCLEHICTMLQTGVVVSSKDENKIVCWTRWTHKNIDEVIGVNTQWRETITAWAERVRQASSILLDQVRGTATRSDPRTTVDAYGQTATVNITWFPQKLRARIFCEVYEEVETTMERPLMSRLTEDVFNRMAHATGNPPALRITSTDWPTGHIVKISGPIFPEDALILAYEKTLKLHMKDLAQEVMAPYLNKHATVLSWNMMWTLESCTPENVPCDRVRLGFTVRYDARVSLANTPVNPTTEGVREVAVVVLENTRDAEIRQQVYRYIQQHGTAKHLDGQERSTNQHDTTTHPDEEE